MKWCWAFVLFWPAFAVLAEGEKSASLSETVLTSERKIANNQEWQLLGEFRWKSEDKVGKIRIGGLSGLVLRGDRAFLLSDDRGLVHEPRLYEFKIQESGKVWKLVEGKVHFLKLPSTEKIKIVLDPESLVGLPSGNFLVSSEGDNNKRPRVPPRIFEINPVGKWIAERKLPDNFIPESTGQQKKGISNNFAIEAMSLSEDGESLWFTSERPLVQDVVFDDPVYRFRMVNQNLKTGEEKQYYFEAPPPDEKADGILLVRGWSEMIHLKGKRFLLLERSLYIAGGKNLQYECRLVEADFSDCSDVTKLKSLAKQKNLVSARMNGVFRLQKNSQALGNCEGMAWGPARGDFKQTLWIITDNNFSKNTDSVLYFFGEKN